MSQTPRDFTFRYSVLLAGLLLCWASVALGQSTIPAPALCDSTGQCHQQQLSIDAPSFADNLQHYQSALDDFACSENWKMYIHTGNYFSRICYVYQRYDQYIQNARRINEIAQQKLLPTEADYEIARHNDAISEAIRGNFYQSTQALLHLLQEVGPQLDSIGRAEYYQNIGSFYKELGDYDEAIRYLERAIELRRISEETSNSRHVSAHSELAHSHKLKGNYPAARQGYLNTLRQADQIGRYNKSLIQIYLYCYQNLADLHRAEGDFPQAHHYLQLALDFQAQDSYAKAHDTYRTLGHTHLDQEQYEPALVAFRQAVATARETYNYNAVREDDKHHTVAQCWMDIGTVHLRQEQYAEALTAYRKALYENTYDYRAEDLESLPQVDNFINLPVGLDVLRAIIQCYHQRYRSTSQREDLLRVLRVARLARALIQRIRQRYEAEGSKQTLVGKAKNIYEMAINSAVLMYELTGDRAYLYEAFRFSESSKAVLLLESIQGQLALGGGGLPPELVQRERQLRSDWTYYKKRVAIARKEKERTDPERRREWEQRLFTTSEAYKQLIADFERNYPNYYQLKFNTDLVEVATIQENVLDTTAALLTYFMGEEKHFALYLTANDIEVHHWPTNQRLRQRLSSLRQLLINEPQSSQFQRDYDTFLQLAHQIYDELLAPLLRQLPGSVERLLIISDNIINDLPFEILLRQNSTAGPVDYSPQTLPYLFRDYNISYHYSATLLLSNAQKAASQAPYAFLGFAPSFGLQGEQRQRVCSGSQLYDLHCNQKEVERISTYFSSKNLLAEAATKRAFIELMAEYRIVHLATHACIDESNIDLSQIHFSDEGLSSYDLQNLDLTADLVVLSACNTGAGKLVKGEGTLSLSRSFTYAGCPSTLMSLWSIDDCATSEIMIAFYHFLSEGQAKDEALRSAKLDYLARSSDRAKAHPYYWAGFVQTGKTTPLFRPNRFTYAPLFVLCLLLLGWRMYRQSRSTQRT